MKIAPMTSLGGTVAQPLEDGGMAQKLRSLKMKTNATPGFTPETAPEPLPSDPKSIISASNEATAQPVGEDTQPLSPQLARLARERRALAARERAIAEKEKAISEKSATPADAITKAQLLANPLRTMLEAGVTYDQLTQAVLDEQSGKSHEVIELKKRLESLETGIETKLSERDKQAEQQALAEMRKEATSLMAQGDEFALVRETGSINQVMQLIERTYRETGDVLLPREAMKLVEDELLNDYTKIASLEKLKGQGAQVHQQSAPQIQRQMRTLTNRDTAQMPLDRKARALLAFRGELKR